IFWPATYTSPAVGVSSPPSRCSSVLLPAPDAPRIATVSPAATSKSSPSNTRVRKDPSAYVLPSPVARRTLSGSRLTIPGSRASLITQCLRGRGARRAPCRIDGGQERHDQRHQRDPRHVDRVELRRQPGDVVHVFRQQHHAEGRFDRLQDVLQV